MLVNQSDIVDDKAIYFSVIEKHCDYVITLAKSSPLKTTSIASQTKSSTPHLTSRKDKRRLDFAIFANYHKVIKYKKTMIHTSRGTHAAGETQQN